MKQAKAIVLVVDGGGVGASEDAAAYSDLSSFNSIGNTAKAVGGLRLPNFERLGFGNITTIEGVATVSNPVASWGRLRESSNGKDSVTGHWEMMGITVRHAFPTYPNGFPPEVIGGFEEVIGRKTLGNVAASGTEIIERLCREHFRTGYPIVYTSADSVFQVAAHEDIVPVETLWDWCAKARAMLVPPDEVNRVIARPFAGKPGALYRTSGRRDFAVEPPSPSMLEVLQNAGVPTSGIGKINDIYCGKGIAQSWRVADNNEAVRRTVEWLERPMGGFCFTNLNDFDSKYGHRRDADGYAKALIQLDSELPDMLNKLGGADRLIVTADHGCDPTAPGSDHTREFVPLLDYRPGSEGRGLGSLDSFSQVGARILETFGVAQPEALSV